MTTPDVLRRLTSLIAERYVFPDAATTIVAALADADLDGLDAEQAATTLTRLAQSVNNDRHLRVRPRTSGAPESADAWELHYAADALRNAGGVQSVTRLDASTGLLVIAPYTSPVHLAEPYVRAAFAMLAGVERLVIDVRKGRGGVPETVALICGYLLGSEPVHLQDIVERDGTARQYWTSPAAQRLDDDVAVYVLTSSNTFSGCEELAYNLQAQQRATIIGERTGGGAHPIEVFALDDVLELTLPMARSVNAVTGTNWEQVGVVPDVACAAADALAKAQELMAHRRPSPGSIVSTLSPQ